MHPPPGFPGHEIGLAAHEARALARGINMEFGGEMTLLERTRTAFNECDAIGFKTCREMEGAFYEFVAKFVNKPVLLAGPAVPGVPGLSLEYDIDRWLKGFGPGMVVYCALGSECALEKDQFQRLVLGLELS